MIGFGVGAKEGTIVGTGVGAGVGRRVRRVVSIFAIVEEERAPTEPLTAVNNAGLASVVSINS